MTEENIAWRTRLLIGSPNDTHRVNPDYLAPVQEWLLSLNLPGWTMYRTLGGWKDNPAEEGVLVDIVGDHEITFGQVDALRAKLNQSAIGVTVEPVTSAFIDSATGEPKTLLIQRGKEVYRSRVEAIQAELKEAKEERDERAATVEQLLIGNLDDLTEEFHKLHEAGLRWDGNAMPVGLWTKKSIDEFVLLKSQHEVYMVEMTRVGGHYPLTEADCERLHQRTVKKFGQAALDEADRRIKLSMSKEEAEAYDKEPLTHGFYYPEMEAITRRFYRQMDRWKRQTEATYPNPPA
jgi:hypothetical protein